MKQVLDHLSTLNSLCSVLGMDFKQTIHEVHPSLSETDGPKSISNETISSLATAIQRLREVKIQRMQRVSGGKELLFVTIIMLFSRGGIFNTYKWVDLSCVLS